MFDRIANKMLVSKNFFYFFLVKLKNFPQLNFKDTVLLDDGKIDNETSCPM